MNDPSDHQFTIEVADRQTLAFNQSPLSQVVQLILEDHGYHQGEISIAVVDDPTMKALNKQHLDHDYETDVLSFVLERNQEIGLLDGQLIASADTAQRMANQLEISLHDELLLYVVHGALHLVGLSDQTPEEAALMRDAEANYLGRYGVEHRWLDESDGVDES